MQDQDIYVKWSLLLIMEFGKVKKILKFQLNGQTEKQIIIKGRAKKISKKESDKYFQSRPRSSRIAAWASNQSKKISYKNELEESFLKYEEKFKDKKIPLPNFWGGFLVEPKSIEFWIGKKSRMHDRTIYLKNLKSWKIQKLYP